MLVFPMPFGKGSEFLTSKGSELARHEGLSIMARGIEGAWYRSSKGTWYATVNGKSISLGVKGRENEAEAKTAWHRLMGGMPIVMQTPKPEPTPKDEQKPNALTITNIIDGFLADAGSRLKPPTMRLYRDHLSRFGKKLGSMESDALTTKQISQWIHTLPYASTTKGIMLRAVIACLSWAETNGMMADNPARKVPKPKCKSRAGLPEAVITSEQHEAMMAKALPAQRHLLLMLHDTGCRPGEACKVTAEAFHADAGCVILHDHKTEKTGKPRVIFLSPELAELFKVQAERYPKGALLRTSWGTPWNAQSVNLMVRRLGKRCGFKAMPYGYRHGFATAGLSNGIPDAQVAALLGHSSTAMLHRHYSHLTSQSAVLKEALSRVRG